MPYQIKQLIITTRRELEAKADATLTLEELLGLCNSLIHDLQIAQGTQKEKSKVKRFRKEGEELAKQKGRSLLTGRTKG